jgi:hypothetical protein
MPRKGCERESYRERQRLQQEGRSLQATPPQDYPSSFIKISSPIQKLIRRDTQAHRQYDDHISLLLFFQSKESRLKI